MRVRPVSVIVLAGLGMTLAAVMTLEVCLTVRYRLRSLSGGDMISREMMKDSFYYVYSIVSLVLPVGLVGMLWAGSIGSLRLSGWARKMMLHYAWMSVVYAGVSEAFYMMYVAPYVFEPAMRKASWAWGVPYTPWSLSVWGLMMIAIRLGLLAAFAGAVLVCFNRAAVRRAFEGVEVRGFEVEG